MKEVAQEIMHLIVFRSDAFDDLLSMAYISQANNPLYLLPVRQHVSFNVTWHTHFRYYSDDKSPHTSSSSYSSKVFIIYPFLLSYYLGYLSSS